MVARKFYHPHGLFVLSDHVLGSSGYINGRGVGPIRMRLFSDADSVRTYMNERRGLFYSAFSTRCSEPDDGREVCPIRSRWGFLLLLFHRRRAVQLCEPARSHVYDRLDSVVFNSLNAVRFWAAVLFGTRAAVWIKYPRVGRGVLTGIMLLFVEVSGAFITRDSAWPIWAALVSALNVCVCVCYRRVVLYVCILHGCVCIGMNLWCNNVFS